MLKRNNAFVFIFLCVAGGEADSLFRGPQEAFSESLASICDFHPIAKSRVEKRMRLSVIYMSPAYRVTAANYLVLNRPAFDGEQGLFRNDVCIKMPGFRMDLLEPSCGQALLGIFASS